MAQSPAPEKAPYGYVTEEGLVRVHPEVMKALGLPHGGVVVFVKSERGHWLILSEAQYARFRENPKKLQS